MPLKQSEYLQYCRDEVKRSKRWRGSEGYEDEWKRFIDLYRGKHYNQGGAGDRLIVNLTFSTINVLAPAVAVNNPKFVVNARSHDKAPHAVVTEEILNYMWRTHRYQEEFRLAVMDWLTIGHGWAKCGYKFAKPPEERKTDAPTGSTDDAAAEYGVDDREDVEGNVESEMYVYENRPFVERISPFDMFVDPDARHPKEMCWIAQRIWRPIADVMVDSRYQPGARKNVSASSWSRWATNSGDQDGRSDKPDMGPKSWCEVVEFYDIKRRTVCTFSLASDADKGRDNGFLIKPRPMPYAMGHPFEMLRNFEVPDNFYPIGDIAQIESLQLELNATRTQMMNHRKRFQRKWLYEKDAFDRDGIAALESDVDNTLVPVTSDGNPSNTVAPMPAVMTPTDFYDQSGLITNDIDRVSGVSDYARGAGQTSIKRTATEAAMIQDAANSRAQDRLAKIETALARLGERIIGLMQQYLTGEQVARIVTMPGRAWVNYDADYIQGEFDFEVAAGSTEPMNETFRRQSALQLVDASMPFLEMGVANPQALYMHILQKGFGVKDAQPFLMQQGEPQPDPATGQPMPADGQVPPGMDPSMVQGPPPMPPSPQNPTDLTAPQQPEMPQIDEAMLMQMLGSGAPTPAY